MMMTQLINDVFIGGLLEPTTNTTRIIYITVSGLLLSVIGYHLYRRQSIMQKSRKVCPAATTASTGSITAKKGNFMKKERPVVICPFSQGTDFIVETAENLPLTPLEMYEDWVMEYQRTDIDDDANKRNALKPLAARWLIMGMSGQDTPGILRAGLRRLKNTKYFLVEEPHRLKTELLLKKKALDDPQRFPHVFVAQPESLDAQRECLDMFLAYLPRRYPDQYVYDTVSNTITVKCINTTFHISDYYNTRPLELCERIVQEDLCLMSPPKSREAEMAVTESYRMAAAAVVFSFEGLPEKLGQPMEFLHAPVPGYEKHIRKSMNITFSKLKSEQPVWRNNWGIGPSGEMDKPLYGTVSSMEQRKMTDITEDDIKSMFLKVEYETIRRLPKTRYILFTIKSMCDPMSALERLPMAAACLAKSIRGMSTDMHKYKGIDNDDVCQAVLKYLDRIYDNHQSNKGSGSTDNSSVP
jgi:hypothetical protein